MGLIKNYPSIASSDSRKIVLNLLEAGLAAIQFDTVLSKNFTFSNDSLGIMGNTYDLKNFDNLYLVAFGKGSAKVSLAIEKKLNDKIKDGYVIDVSEEKFSKIKFTLGTHPLPSKENLEFTANVVRNLQNLTARDLVLVIICGGGSAMFESLNGIDLDRLIDLNKALLSSGADIFEINTIRKHVSNVKGGGLAKILYPAKIVSLIFSDVPGNDLSFIASGPTVLDQTKIDDAFNIYKNKKLEYLGLDQTDFTETPKDPSLFANVDNILMLSNLTALTAMKLEAEKWGLAAEIYTDKFKSDALIAGKTLIQNTRPGHVLLAGGETTVKVKNANGKGGRNQTVVLSCLDVLDKDTIIASIDSDGWDNTSVAGAIGDSNLLEKAKKLNIKIGDYLNNDNSYLFFNRLDDAIITGRLPSNVADLFVVYKK